MIIGILSDSHGRYKAARKALKIFDAAGVENIIHCGDVGGPNVFDEFVDRAFHFVWGNTDDADQSTIAYVQALGFTPPQETPLRLNLDGKSIAVFHGHEPGFESACRSLVVDYLLHGHTHVCRDERIGNRRIINPGALHRAARKTVAILNTESDRLVFEEIDPEP